MKKSKGDLEKNEVFFSEFPIKSRPSIIVKQLDITNPIIPITTMEEFAQDLKFYSPNLFKEIKSFINKRESLPFSGEAVFFLTINTHEILDIRVY